MNFPLEGLCCLRPGQSIYSILCHSGLSIRVTTSAQTNSRILHAIPTSASTSNNFSWQPPTSPAHSVPLFPLIRPRIDPALRIGFKFAVVPSTSRTQTTPPSFGFESTQKFARSRERSAVTSCSGLHSSDKINLEEWLCEVCRSFSAVLQAPTSRVRSRLPYSTI